MTKDLSPGWLTFKVKNRNSYDENGQEIAKENKYIYSDLHGENTQLCGTAHKIKGFYILFSYYI